MFSQVAGKHGNHASRNKWVLCKIKFKAMIAIENFILGQCMILIQVRCFLYLISLLRYEKKGFKLKKSKLHGEVNGDGEVERRER